MRRTIPSPRVLRSGAVAAALAAGAVNAWGADAEGPRLGGFVSEEIAYTFEDPKRWSRAVTRVQLSLDGSLGRDVKYRLGGRIDVDPVYYESSFYLDRVKKDQRFSAIWRENYLDFTAGDWAFRIGAQHIIWGEVVGLFFADVVSARDSRDFLLPSFDIIRIPQWALRTEYFAGDSHVELVWIPLPTLDDIGKPGADFYPVSLGSRPTEADAARFLDPKRPSRGIGNGNFGARAGTLVEGWDVAAYFYRSYSVSPTFYRVAGSSPSAPFVFEPRHDRIWQLGSTVTKDFGSVVLRAEAVYADGQNFASLDPGAPEGVVDRRTLDWIISGDYPFATMEGRINVQVFNRHYFGGSEAELALQYDWGASVLVSAKLSPQWEPSLQWIQTFGGGGAMIRPRLAWTPVRNLSIAFGADIFNGDRNGAFGRYADKDRAYTEIRYSF
jgi:hypothetical protein